MIPTYRAKKIDSDEWVEGYYGHIDNTSTDYIATTLRISDTGSLGGAYYKIDPNTLAIHFPNMIDKNGKKIFGSLNYDDYGLGGDILYRGENTKKFPLYFNAKEPIAYYDEWEDYEIIGIHKGAES